VTRLLLLGLNHTTAPLEVRERLAFNADQARAAITALRAKFPESEAVLLSTCNRVELYVGRAVHGHPRAEQMAAFISDFHGVPLEQFRPHLYERSGRELVEHLFSVTTSLGSMVLGESQILGQVRQAYDTSCELGAAGAAINPLFQRAMAVGKEVQSSTTLGNGSLSVSGVAVGYAKRIFDRFEDKSVLCVGAGKMAVLALKGFVALKPRRLVICNRDGEKARRIASELGHGGIGMPLEGLDEQLIQADIVITSTGSTRPIITRRQVEGLLKQRRYRPMFLIDIAVPRDVEPSAGELDHVYLYNLDDLQHAIAETYSQRGEAVESARAIVKRHVDEFLVWQRQREMGPMIDQLYRRLHSMAAEEAGRAASKMPQLDLAGRAELDELARRIVNKLLHDPLKALKEADQLHGPPSGYLHAIQEMFKLDHHIGADQPAENDDDEEPRRDATAG
jgi:glutamyl-tRNA reductase